MRNLSISLATLLNLTARMVMGYFIADFLIKTSKFHGVMILGAYFTIFVTSLIVAVNLKDIKEVK